jgi:hypothetical protein
MSIRYLILSSFVLVACNKNSGTIDDTSNTATTETGTTDTSTATTDTSTTDTSGTTVTTDTSTTDTSTTDTGGWEPTADRYTLTPGNAITNDCGDAFDEPDPGDTVTTRFSWNGDKISIGFEREPAVECDWEFPGFPLCALMEETDGQQGTVITYQSAMEGEWSEPAVMSGIFSISIDCAGNGCDMFASQLNIASFPCAVAVPFTGEL